MIASLVLLVRYDPCYLPALAFPRDFTGAIQLGSFLSFTEGCRMMCWSGLPTIVACIDIGHMASTLQPARAPWQGETFCIPWLGCIY